MSAGRRGGRKRERSESQRGSSAAEGDRQQPWSTRGSRVERIDRVLVPELAERIVLEGQEAHHLRDVLRVRPGSVVEAFDGRGRVARGAVDSVDRGAVTLTLGPGEPSSAEAPVAVTLAVALLKGDKLADVVRPATELGVAAFVLFVSTNCEARELSAVKLTRLRRVAQEAARQSGRAVVPTVEGPYAFADLQLESTALIGDPAAEQTFSDVVAGWSAGERGGDTPPPAAKVSIVTGPEGGLTELEVEALVARGATGLRLGPRILRADTAPVAMAAALLLGVEGAGSQ